jgi:hypothetical protein
VTGYGYPSTLQRVHRHDELAAVRPSALPHGRLTWLPSLVSEATSSTLKFDTTVIQLSDDVKRDISLVA